MDKERKWASRPTVWRAVGSFVPSGSADTVGWISWRQRAWRVWVGCSEQRSVSWSRPQLKAKAKAQAQARRGRSGDGF